MKKRLLTILRLLKRPFSWTLIALILVYGSVGGNVTIVLFLAIAEIWYLLLNWNGGPLQNAVQTKDKNLPIIGSKVESALSGLLFILGIAPLFIFQYYEPAIDGRQIDIGYERWEAVALISSLFVSVLAFWLMEFPNSFAMPRVMGASCAVVAVLTWNALTSLAEQQHMKHLYYFLAIAALSLVLNIVVAVRAPEERRRCIEMAAYADFPTVAALIIISIFCNNSADTDQNTAIFVSGAVTFQFLWSSAVVTLIEARVSDLFPFWPKSAGAAGGG